MSIFNNSKYSKWYFSIIKAAQCRINEGYTESHHIIPRSLGGTNDSTNLVNLTAREHFICHLLLTKMVSGSAKQKMAYAAWAMTTLHANNQQRHKVKSHQYQYLREQVSQSRKNKPFSEEHKQKLSEAAKTRIRTPRTNPSTSKGQSRPKEVVEKISNGIKEFHTKRREEGKRPSPELIEKRNKSLRRHYANQTSEAKEKRAEAIRQGWARRKLSSL